MTLGKRFWLFFLFILVLGAGAGAAVVEVPDRVNATPISVPAGQVGDEFTYAYHLREPGDDGHVAHDTPWELAGSEEIKVERLATTVDEYGGARDVVVIATNLSRAYGSGVSMSDDAASISFLEPSTEYDLVDLESRMAIRTDMDRNPGDEEPLPFDLAVNLFFEKSPNLQGLQYQGQTLSPRDDVTHLNELPMPRFYAVVMMGMGFSIPLSPMLTLFLFALVTSSDDLIPSDARFTSMVSGEGTIDGHDALGVYSELVVHVPERYDEDYVAFWNEETAGGTIRIVKSDWLTDEFAYPLMSQVTVHLETTSGEEMVLADHSRTLSVFEAGTGEAIPWGEGQTSFEPERSDGGLEMQEGAGSGLAYPLSTALDDITDNPFLLRYNLWRLDNPEAEVVEAIYRPMDSHRGTSGGQEWYFMLATPAGNGYSLSTQRLDGMDVAQVEELGPISNAIDYEDVPEAYLQEDMITLAAAEQIWALTMADDDPPNFVVWGEGVWSPSKYHETFCPALEAEVNIDAEAWQPYQTLKIGRTSSDDCLDVNSSFDDQVLLVDRMTGAPVFGYGAYREFDYLGLGLGGDSEGPESDNHAASPLSLTMARVEAAMFGSTTLLVLFLSVWFLPLVKFFGTKGLLLVPGFSRIVKGKLLDHKVRDRLMQMIEETPGIHASELGRRAGVGWGTVVHHLSVMEKNELISSLTSGRHRRFFPVGAVDWSRRGQAAVLANERTHALYSLIQEDPGAAASHLASRVGVGLSTASWHLQRLEECGLVGRVKRGRTVHHYANDDQVGSKEGTTGMEIA